jgi:all-trans-8'-apo-beta-carotenal 15,15'-oxygenase
MSYVFISMQDNASYIMGAAPAASCVRWVPGRPTIVHVVPRPSASPEIRAAGSKTFTAPPLFVFHHANAYEKDDDGHKIVIDSIHYDSLPAVGREALASQGVDADAAFTSRLRRVEIDLETHVMVRVFEFDADVCFYGYELFGGNHFLVRCN